MKHKVNKRLIVAVANSSLFTLHSSLFILHSSLFTLLSPLYQQTFSSRFIIANMKRAATTQTAMKTPQTTVSEMSPQR